jgi:hypothetical protein
MSPENTSVAPPEGSDGRQRAPARRSIGFITIDDPAGGLSGNWTGGRQGDLQPVQRLGALTLQFLVGKGRIADQVGHQGHGLRKHVRRRIGEHIGEVRTGTRPDRRAQRLDLGRDFGG